MRSTGSRQERTLGKSAGQSARTRLLDAAEVILSDRGLPALTVRELTQAAGVNLATVNYVFGSKDALLIGLHERMLAPMIAARQQRFRELQAAEVVDLRAVVLALVEPLVWMRADHGVAAAELYRHTTAHPDSAVRAAASELLEPDLHSFEGLVLRALPGRPRTAVAARARLVCQVAVPTVLRVLDLSDPGTDPAATADVEPLVDFIVGGLTGPPDTR